MIMPTYPSRGNPQISQSVLLASFTNVQWGQTFSAAGAEEAAPAGGGGGAAYVDPPPAMGESIPSSLKAADGALFPVACGAGGVLVRPWPAPALDPFVNREEMDDSAMVSRVDHPPEAKSCSAAS